jgi:hypothetical protein
MSMSMSIVEVDSCWITSSESSIAFHNNLSSHPHLALAPDDAKHEKGNGTRHFSRITPYLRLEISQQAGSGTVPPFPGRDILRIYESTNLSMMTLPLVLLFFRLLSFSVSVPSVRSLDDMYVCACIVLYTYIRSTYLCTCVCMYVCMYVDP